MGGNYITNKDGELKLVVYVISTLPEQQVQIDIDVCDCEIEVVVVKGKER